MYSDMKRTIRAYCEQFHADKLDNLAKFTKTASGKFGSPI